MKRTTRAPATRNRRLSWPVSMTILAGLFAAPFVLSYLVHPLLYPWAVSLTGAPTLTGYWQGQTSFPNEGTRRVVMDLRAEPRGGRCGNCPPIDGEFKVCHAGRPTVYEIWGHADDRSATCFSLTSRLSEQSPAKPPGMTLGGLDGRWPGGDTISLAAADRQHPGDQPVRFPMRRTTETAFTAC